MAINEGIMQLVEEMFDPAEIALEGVVEDEIEAEDDILFGTAEDDDDIIDFIDNGGLGYEDPVNFADDDEVEKVLDDDTYYQ